MAAPISSSRAGDASCGGTPIVCCSARTASSASSIPSGFSVRRSATSCESSSSRSPPTADSSAISHSAAIETVSLTSRRSATARSVVVEHEPRARSVRRLEGAEVRAPTRRRLGGENGAHRPGGRRERLGERGDALEVGEQRHRPRIEIHGRVGPCPNAATTPERSSLLSARPTTGSARRSPSGRIRAGGGRWCDGFRGTAEPCSTSRREPASSPSNSSPPATR